MSDDQPERPASGNGVADVDADADVLREFAALSDLLVGLSRQVEEPALPLVVESPEPGPLSRWVLVLQGLDRLVDVAAIREELLKIPFCIAVRVTDVTVEETRAILTATAGLDAPELEQMLTEALQVVGAAGVVQSVAKYSPPGG